jgi:hypothetical protein
MTIAFRAAVTQGGSYLLTCTYAINGVDQLPLLASIASQVRTQAGVLLDACTVNIAAPSFTLEVVPADTADWPVGKHLQDICYTYLSGRVAYTPVWYVDVAPRETV